MLIKRIITALLLLPLVGYLLFGLNIEEFATAMIVVTYLMAWEWSRLSSVSSKTIHSLYALFISIVCLLIWFYAPGIEMWPGPNWFLSVQIDTPLLALWASLLGWFIAFAIIFSYPKMTPILNRGPWIRLALGIMILVGFWVSMISLRSTEMVMKDFYRGGFIVLFMLCMIWAVDIGGYVFGKLFGKHKLAPQVSPGKTWQGFFGGLLFCLLVAFVGVKLLELPVENYGVFVFVIALLTGISVCGDLFESALKRQVNMKDSSQMLPGHGGLLDRMDSSIAVAPFFLIMSKAMGWL